jgi:dTDP-4-dehydrorhamnose reductase
MGRFQPTCLVVGAQGMLGTDLVKLLKSAGTPTVALDVPEVDIRDAGSVREIFAAHRPDVVINVAAFTDVDGCQSKSDEAFRVNALGPENLAGAALDHGAHLVHISTDYVFDGSGRVPYTEDDPLSPLGVYGKSKAEGEIRLKRILPQNHLIVRTQWLFGRHGKNFVKAILDAATKNSVLKVVNDQHGCPTYTPDLAAGLLKLMEIGARGTFHVTNRGETTWYDFAVRILDRAGMTGVRVESITSEELGRPAPRPAYSVLDGAKFVGLTGSTLRTWEDALDDYLSGSD